jgi:hypothetical protein
MLLAVCCLLLQAGVANAAISTEELQRIEKAVPKKAAAKLLYAVYCCRQVLRTRPYPLRNCRE